MQITNLIDLNISNKTVVGLGFFDCVHIGHKKLLSKVVEIAQKHRFDSAVFTFSDDLSIYFKQDEQIFSFNERKQVFRALNIDKIIVSEVNKDIMELSPKDFFDMLVLNHNIGAIVVGNDYKFGKNAFGDVNLLKNLAKEHNIELHIVDFEMVGDSKISSSNLKSLLKSGDIISLNSMLTKPYFMIGSVVHGRSQGRKLGFPTANIAVNESKLMPKSGVYLTKTIIDGQEFLSITNIGAKPTFDIDESSIETHIIDFCGDLYDKTISVEFVCLIRNIKKFSTLDSLKDQLNTDIAFAKSFKLYE